MNFLEEKKGEKKDLKTPHGVSFCTLSRQRARHWAIRIGDPKSWGAASTRARIITAGTTTRSRSEEVAIVKKKIFHKVVMMRK